MFGAIITILIVISVLFGVAGGESGALSAAALNGCGKAVTLCIELAGAMALWGGLMRVAEKCGITRLVCRIVRKPLGLLFRGLDDGKSMELISLNVAANLLGLGNAATPLGINAMKRLNRSDEDSIRNRRHSAMFILLNTASIQLIPITVSAMRMEHGAADPWDCALPALLTSVCSVAIGAVITYLLYSRVKKRKDI